MKKAWILLYALMLLGDVIGLLGDIPFLIVFCKPLLMPLLIWGIWQHRKDMADTPWPLIIIGLLFSWAGDLFLLYEKRNATFFMFGLISFLLAHVSYIIYYYRSGASLAIAWRKYKGWLIFTLVYAAGLVWLLYPTLGALRSAVMVYALVLVSMLTGAIALIGAVSKISTWFFVIGATAFVISDSALAINKFYTSFPLAGVIIIMTYGIAQWLIATGAILNNRADTV